VIFGDGLQGKVGVAHDPGEQVVEVVGHAAGKTSNGFELLRLKQLLLQPPAFGHVHHETHQSLAASAILVSALAAHREPAGMTIGVEHPEVELTTLSGFSRTPESLLDREAIRRVDQLQKRT
jgi:hypothetical protein